MPATVASHLISCATPCAATVTMRRQELSIREQTVSQPHQQPMAGYGPAGTQPPGGYYSAAGAPGSGATPGYPPPPAQPTFQVRTVKHTGGLIFWLNQRYTTTGSYAQCEAAIDDAQKHCMLAGWWSVGSLLWNPISLSQNASARTALRRQAQQAHDYAVWWTTYYGGLQNTAVWTPPPAQPARRKWWLWIPLVFIGLNILLFILLLIIGLVTEHADHRSGDAALGSRAHAGQPLAMIYSPLSTADAARPARPDAGGASLAPSAA